MTSPIRTIALKEIREIVRDGRLRLLGALVLILGIAALTFGAQQTLEAQAAREDAQSRASKQWRGQGKKNPHVAAHYGTYVFAPATVVTAIDWSGQPRTAMGLGADGQVMLVTVDGRTSAGSGLTQQHMAELMADLGAVHALGLDGGGSTTMIVDDCWLNDVVNNPSDDASAGHAGSRPVGSGLYVR